ncbi:hypothetical protein CYLTODRAFT_26607 [Cylindrobasidium torrendii FP15055 ss-10]|uniref:Uncharacterized protein n=1 Tax=Cylindrobasidium torrendii FP15055 ss-10 TaxID=1314674 RepID=A0A0D7B805_9AGAR|nr:hypothetical protein CYLTODRAFT_26607 [Cylindrobasidium torrendii FP15055 ss-10]
MSSPDMNWHAALGLKGTPRLRPHSRENHAHIELRAIEPPEDAPDKSGNVLYFSFFTTKAINMKTNKELLVRIAGRFDGRAFIVEGDKGGPEDEPIRPPPDVPEGPARLRKARWSAFSAAELHAKAAVTHADASVQAEPAMAEAVVQTHSPSQITPIKAAQKTSSAVQCDLDEPSPAGNRGSRKAITSKQRANASSRVSARVARSMSPLSPLSDLEESDMEVSPPLSHRPSPAPVRSTNASPAVCPPSASVLDPNHGQQRMTSIPLPARPPSPTTHAPKPLRPTIITNPFVSESTSDFSATHTPANESVRVGNQYTHPIDVLIEPAQD